MPAPTRYGLAATRVSTLLARPMVAVTARQARDGKMIDRLSTSMAPLDAGLVRRHNVRDGLGRSLAESFRQGTGPATWDGVAVARGEGFRLEEIRTEVVIWHGEKIATIRSRWREPSSNDYRTREPSTTQTMAI
jgi:hypothetical protein